MNDNHSTTILMADDDPSHLVLSEAALAGAGFMVHTVGDGADAVAQFEPVKPDVVILDVNMPRMSGIDACREIRKRAGGRSLPILMLTGRNDLPAISDAFAAGASDFAQKGLNPRLLVERVRFLLRDRELQDELRSSRSKLLLAQRIARVGHWELSLEGRTLHASPMLSEILEVDAQTLGRFEDFVRMLDGSEQVAVRQAFVACATGAGRFSFDHDLRTSRGTAICVHQEAELVTDGPAQEGTVIVTLQDLTRLHRAEEAVRRLSYFDTATGLPNRRHLSEQVSAALADGSGVVAAGVVAFRLHGFDRVVQAQGLEHANKLVARVAKCIEQELESLSQGGAIPWRTAPAAVCRTADGELAMLLRSRVSAEHAAGVARAILESVTARAAGPDSEYMPALSAGIALAEGGMEADQLIQNAHAAADQASQPRSCEIFSPVPQARTRRRLLIETALRGAIERGEMSLTYRPRVAVDTYELTGVECVPVWENAQVGAVTHDEFITIAEGAGTIDEIGRWVLDEACRQLAAWRRQFERDFFVSLKLSARQLRDPDLVVSIQDALYRNGLPGSALEIALTEASIVAAPRDAESVFRTLRASGIRVSIDDFGAGYSSFSHIRRLPFDGMKLDRSLVAELYTDVGAQGVIAAVLAMARGLKARAVADGIEDSATLQMLNALGCDEVQGPYVSQPLGARFFETWLEDGGAAILAQHHAQEIIDALEAVERGSTG
jgi:EAL domain-containing protein (putative c-di-GMP-specific phosphodiesterase class I)/DNA-binding response OmpR family regulator/GGDEF domain-containing protein